MTPPGFIGMEEDAWFEHHTPLIRAMLTTEFGRSMLAVPDGDPIYKVTKSSVHRIADVRDGLATIRAEFVPGDARGWLLRERFGQFQSFARYFDHRTPIRRAAGVGESALTAAVRCVMAGTLVSHPDAHPETNTFDGFVQRFANESFATKRAGAGTGSDDTGTNPGAAAYIGANASGSTWLSMNRGIAGFLTSSLGASVTVSAGTCDFYGRDMVDNFSQSVCLDKPSPGSATAVADSDFNIANWAGVEQSTARISVGSWTTAGYNTFTLSATGLSNVSKTGVTWLGIRLSGDFDNSEPTWSASVAANADAKGAEGGSSVYPTLTITYTLPATLLQIERTPIRGVGRGIMRP